MKAILKNTKPLEQYFNIKFDKIVCNKHTNGFISVQVDWRARRRCEDFWRFKYAHLALSGFGGIANRNARRTWYNIAFAEFEFTDIKDCVEKLDIYPRIGVHLATDNEEDIWKEQYSFFHVEQTKYGLIVWFTPNGWENWQNTTAIN